MTTPTPWFIEWVEVTPEGWRLKAGAPTDVQKAFKTYMRLVRERDKPQDARESPLSRSQRILLLRGIFFPFST